TACSSDRASWPRSGTAAGTRPHKRCVRAASRSRRSRASTSISTFRRRQAPGSVVATVFPLVPRRRVIGLAFGGVRSARRGVGSDVASTREYRPGDDVAWMDWAASARLSAARGTDEFIVKERYADEAPRVVVVADRRPSMSITASTFRSLDKPKALLSALELIGDSARA